jgi:hypothetical protein
MRKLAAACFELLDALQRKSVPAKTPAAAVIEAVVPEMEGAPVVLAS